MADVLVSRSMRDEAVTSCHGVAAAAAAAATAQEAVPLGLERPGSPRAQLVGQVGGSARAPSAWSAGASAESEATRRLAERPWPTRSAARSAITLPGHFCSCPTAFPHRTGPRHNPLDQRVSASRAEGEGFEPSTRRTTGNGFRDRRIRPLCHPSSGEGGIRTLDAGIHPHNALAGRRLQPLGHFSRIEHGTRFVGKLQGLPRPRDPRISPFVGMPGGPAGGMLCGPDLPSYPTGIGDARPFGGRFPFRGRDGGRQS